MRKLEGFWSYVIGTLSLLLVGFHLYTAGFGIFPAMIQRSIHLGFVLVLCFILKPATKKAAKDSVPIYDVILVIFSIMCTGFILLNYEKLLWDPLTWINPLDKILAFVMVFLVLEASRRTVGFTFPVLAILFFIYAYFGPYFPGVWGHQSFGYDILFQTLYHKTTGIWGTMVGISASLLAMFAIFGSLLSQTGGAGTFIKMGQSLTKNSVGGAGKVALIASGLFGMISGSAVANVVATGTFTIPLMKKSKYSNEWAAAISAVGSTGGQIMPPIMGAGSFIMAQILGINYITMAKVAIVPAFLYYFGSYIAIHYVSLKEKISGESYKDKISMTEYIVIFVPIIVFVSLLIKGYTVVTGAFIGVICGFLTSLIVNVKKEKKNPVAIGSNLVYKISLASGQGIVSMASLLAGAQITITLVSMTGFGVKLSDLILSLGQNNLLLSLILAMVICIILGMGLPGTAAYVLAAAIIAPALINLNVDPLVAHLFVFYFANFSTITPPVCAAVYLSSSIAESNWLKTGSLSIFMALPAFIVPYTFAYNQSLMLNGSIVNVVISIITAVIGVSSIGMGVAGYIKKELSYIMRVLLVILGVIMVLPSLILSILGAITFIGIYFMSKADNEINHEVSKI